MAIEFNKDVSAGKKPRCKLTHSFGANDLLNGVSSWLARQPERLQKSVQFLGVFSLQKEDLLQLESTLKQNWNTSFAVSLSQWNNLHSTKQEEKNQMNWECENCDMANTVKTSSCMICEKPKPSKSSDSTGTGSFSFDLFQSTPETRETPPKTKKVVKEETPSQQERKAVLDWKEKQIPTTETPQNKNGFEPESKEFNFIYKILSELNQEQVKHITCSEDRVEEQPRYLFAIFKTKNSSATFVIDKVQHTVEWFDPLVPSVGALHFSPDPRTAHLQKVIQQQTSESSNRAIPKELKEVVGSVLHSHSSSQEKWSIQVNKKANKQKSLEQGSDLYSLWYVMMRFTSERGGPFSAEKLDSTEMTFENIKNLYSDFFQE